MQPHSTSLFWDLHSGSSAVTSPTVAATQNVSAPPPWNWVVFLPHRIALRVPRVVPVLGSMARDVSEEGDHQGERHHRDRPEGGVRASRGERSRAGTHRPRVRPPGAAGWVLASAVFGPALAVPPAVSSRPGRVVVPARRNPAVMVCHAVIIASNPPPRSKNDTDRSPVGEPIKIADRAADTVDGCRRKEHEGVMVQRGGSDDHPGQSCPRRSTVTRPAGPPLVRAPQHQNSPSPSSRRSSTVWLPPPGTPHSPSHRSSGSTLQGPGISPKCRARREMA
jgi:hypothetical protein